MEDNIQFYNFISNLSKAKKTEERVSDNIDLITSLIVNSHKEHIKYAASLGREYAYIFAYNIKATHKGISLNEYIFPNEELLKKIKDRNLSTVRESVNTRMYPFVLTYDIVKVGLKEYVVLLAQWN